MTGKKLRVIVCGGRTYSNVKLLFAFLDRLHAERVVGLIIEGGARGADRLAGVWANERRIALCIFPANWDGHGVVAGFLRNQMMLDWGLPDLVVAFPGARGTADMVRRAEEAGVEVVMVQ